MTIVFRASRRSAQLRFPQTFAQLAQLRRSVFTPTTPQLSHVSPSAHQVLQPSPSTPGSTPSLAASSVAHERAQLQQVAAAATVAAKVFGIVEASGIAAVPPVAAAAAAAFLVPTVVLGLFGGDESRSISICADGSFRKVCPPQAPLQWEIDAEINQRIATM